MQIIRRAILAIALIAVFAPAIAQVPPPVPALPDVERRTSYTLNASTCACSLGSNLALYGDSTDYQNWIEVWVNGVQASYNDPSVGWTITSPTGPLATIPRPVTDGVLTFNSVQTGTIQIVGARRPRRTSQFSENQGVSARNLNQAITDIVAMLREDWDKINDVTGRAVLAPPGETLSILAVAANRANLGACFDSNGNLATCVSVPASTFSAGAGVTFTGTNPTTISVPTYTAGAGIILTGTHPTVIAQAPGLIPTTSTVTISIASPAVVTWANHGLIAGTVVYFCTTAALPTGLTACPPGLGGTMSPNSYESNPTLYYVLAAGLTTNTFEVSLTPGGSAINTSGSQSGTQTAFANSTACAGCIGEHIYVVVPPTGAGDVLCNNGSPDTVWASLNLQPGIWKVWGATGVFGSAGAVFSTNHSSYGIGITNICSTPYCGTTDWHVTTNNANGVLYPFNASIIPIYSANTVINAVSEPVWTGTTIATCFGDLHAERIR